MSPVRTSDSEGADFLRLLNDHPEAFTILGSVDFIATYSADQPRHVTARYGCTSAIEGTPRWFYADTRPAHRNDRHAVDLRLDWCPTRDSAEQLWRARLTAKVEANQWLIGNLTVIDAPPMSALDRTHYAQALDDLTALYRTLTGLPVTAARACLLGSISSVDVCKATGGHPTTEQAETYQTLGILRTPIDGLEWLAPPPDKDT